MTLGNIEQRHTTISNVLAYSHHLEIEEHNKDLEKSATKLRKVNADSCRHINNSSNETSSLRDMLEKSTQREKKTYLDRPRNSSNIRSRLQKGFPVSKNG